MKIPINFLAASFIAFGAASLCVQWLFSRDQDGTVEVPAPVLERLKAQGFVLTAQRSVAPIGSLGYFFAAPDCQEPLILIPVGGPTDADAVRWAFGAAHDKRVFFLYGGQISDSFPETAFVLGEAWKAGSRLWKGDAPIDAIAPVVSVVGDERCPQHAAVDWLALSTLASRPF